MSQEVDEVRGLVDEEYRATSITTSFSKLTSDLLDMHSNLVEQGSESWASIA
jgi:hypothetical protein